MPNSKDFFVNPRYFKVVVYGHKPKSHWRRFRLGKTTHTHSYIHHGYFQAFRELGFNTYWFDDRDNLSGLSFENTLFLTEDQVDKNIPLSRDAVYVTHSSSTSKYEEAGAVRLNLSNYLFDIAQVAAQKTGASQSLEKWDEVTYFDVQNKTIYQPWATNLLPRAIHARMERPLSTPGNFINYVGGIKHDEIWKFWNELETFAKADGIPLRVFSGVDDTFAEKLLLESKASFDIRGNWHREKGYIPCRIWKNMSYGLPVVSNSLRLEHVFQSRLPIFTNASEFLNHSIQSRQNVNMSQIRDNQDWIASNHTFINRINSLLRAVTELKH